MNELAKVPQKIASYDVRAAIQRKFGDNGEQYAVLFEVRNGTAWRANRSVDAVVMGLWPSLGMELWGMEIKISRGDWLREVRDPGKASEVWGYFDRWFLVAPPGVAKPDEVPTPWGWYELTDGNLVKMREASKNAEVKAVDRHFLGALLRRVAKTDDVFIQAAVAEALKEQRRKHDAEIEANAMRRLGPLKEDAEQWAKLRDLLKDKPDDYVYSPDVLDALTLLLRAGVGKSYGGLQSLLAEVERTRESLLKIADDLKIEPGKRPRARR